MKHIRFAIAQINTTVGDLSGNSLKIVEYARLAQKKDADIVVFPELTIPGYPTEDLLLKPLFIKANQQCLHNIAGEIDHITAIIGFADGKDELFNAAAVIHEKKVKGVFHKILLPNYGVFDEKRYFVPGKSCPAYLINGCIIGVTICEDIWKADGPANTLVKKRHAQVLINISSSPFYMGKWKIRQMILRERVQENRVPVVYSNLVGGQDELVFDGMSMAMDDNGRIIAMGKQFEEDLILFDLPVDELPPKHKKTDFLESQGIICVDSGKDHKRRETKTKLIPRSLPEPPEPLQEIYSALVLGTKDYVEKNNFKKVVLGLSGGIDSALTACVAVDAIGSAHVISVVMPSPFTSQKSTKDAKAIAKNLGIKLLCIPIDNAMESYDLILADVFKGLEKDVTEENIQARIRGNILMALSNKFGWLVLTTGNKSEVSVGYCTLYGDMAGGFAVLKDVPKTMVYALSDYRNRRGKKKLIPSSIICKEPSAELRANQKDTDSLPPYDILDKILHYYIVEDRSLSEMLSMEFDPSTVKKVIQLVDFNEYKRRQSPPGIRVTPKAFGKDRRMPITNRYFYTDK